MRLEDAFSVLVKLEQEYATCPVEWQGINMWPLIRQCIWLGLISPPSPSTKEPATQTPKDWFGRTIRETVRPLRNVIKLLQERHDSAGGGAEEVAFISRWPYLQVLPSGKLFDRIVDPLIFAEQGRVVAKKYYFSRPRGKGGLYYPGLGLNAPRNIPDINVPSEQMSYIVALAHAVGMDSSLLISRFRTALAKFVRWYVASAAFLERHPNLKTIYLVCWYMPDAMALTSAARQRGITVVDVQHGKQGRLQASYVGWTRIPQGGYLMMPDKFWCWGQPSCNHILAASPDRNTHRPFVGGFPWLDYYRRYISSVKAASERDMAKGGKELCVLVTTQPRSGANTEPVPDFLVDFLKTSPADIRFVFRCHPNDRNGPEYCRNRLASVPRHIYEIDPGGDNLYDKLLHASHHITAYSSCCYEASAFGVPTLLFGEDSKIIYSEEITSGEFTWTSGSQSELVHWLYPPQSEQSCQAQREASTYIVSSLELAAEVLAGEVPPPVQVANKI